MAAAPDSIMATLDFVATEDNDLPDSEFAQFVPDLEPFEAVSESEAMEVVPVAKLDQIELNVHGP